MEFCHMHTTSKCKQCIVDEQTNKIMKNQDENASLIIKAIIASRPDKQKRRMDVPLIISQVVTCAVLVGTIWLFKS